MNKGPLTQVLDAFQRAGSYSVPHIARLTGLSADVVEAAVEHLLATGRLKAEPLASGCPAGACGGCALLARGCSGPRTQSTPTRGRVLSLVS